MSGIMVAHRHMVIGGRLKVVVFAFVGVLIWLACLPACLPSLQGVHPTGPFHFSLVGNYVRRTQLALATWHDHLSHVPPDLVVLSSSMWDIAGAVGRGDLLLWDKDMPTFFLEGYMANLTHMISYVRGIFPKETVVAFRTSPIPRHDPVTLHMRVVPAHVSHMNKLNAAGTAVAQKLGLPVSDSAALHAGGGQAPHI